MSLLELIIATSMLAMVMATVTALLRTGRAAWEAHEQDYVRIESAHATVRHIVREIRQADAVDDISPPGDDSGRLSLQMPDGSIKVWEHDRDTNCVNYGVNVGTPAQLLAPEVTGLRFRGLAANGAAPASSAADVQCVRVDVTVQLPTQTGGTRLISSWGWVRSW